MHKYFAPAKINKFIDKSLPIFAVLALLSLAYGLFLALFASPPDYQQGEYVRIMYVHVPAAWMALGSYIFLASLSASYFIWQSPMAVLMARAAAIAGSQFCLICLITGAIWGKPIWGAWWVWDARLTSMLILFFIYLGYIVLFDAIQDPEKAAKIVSIFALIGLINIPVIKFSVEWWNTLHQGPSIMRKSGIAIDNSMLMPLLVMFFSFICIFIVTVSLRVKSDLLANKSKRAK